MALYDKHILTIDIVDEYMINGPYQLEVDCIATLVSNQVRYFE